MNKLISSIGLGVATTFALFVFMAKLISSDDLNWQDTEKPPVITVLQTPDEPKVVPRERPKLTPPPPQQLPRVQNEMVSEVSDAILPGYQPTGLKIKTDIGIGNKFNVAPDGDARPIVRVNPKYPVPAARDGIEGWVSLSFDINEIGEVVNVKVTDAEPKRIFNKAATQALRRWKYRAKIVDGKPIVQHNLSVLLEFNMSQSS
ncbi:energy transducer TonB [Thalassotalea sp. M1531]|uniref:Protein TonB n=1 Tax=Thalassotalea algicola TaxID=2716224 RepID=A0A7Y0Q7K3_9GAMM|nr:energy transducer TonB [Thalassotalea algicola]NMP31982.1 energy transducer TonB [Thalassotalea algicola]